MNSDTLKTWTFRPAARAAVFSGATRLMRWLSVAVAVLVSVTPANALVLCLEVDGSTRLEAVLAELCCDEPAPPALARPVAGSDRAGVPSALSTPAGAGCACIDIPFGPASRQVQSVVRGCEASLGLNWILASPLAAPLPAERDFGTRCAFGAPDPDVRDAAPATLATRGVVRLI
ncbi:MAG: hypothetical protein ACT4PU_09105 [Planctomycetota bacterium]